MNGKMSTWFIKQDRSKHASITRKKYYQPSIDRNEKLNATPTLVPQAGNIEYFKSITITLQKIKNTVPIMKQIQCHSFLDLRSLSGYFDNTMPVK